VISSFYAKHIVLFHYLKNNESLNEPLKMYFKSLLFSDGFEQNTISIPWIKNTDKKQEAADTGL
jgi:hypothetical protein